MTRSCRLVLPLCLAISALLGTQGARGTPPMAASVVYPGAPPALRMPHAHPAHRGLACAQCHAPGAGSPRRWPELPAAEASCKPCHAAAIERGAGGDCGLCHVGYDPARPQLVAAATAARPRLRFAHARHREIACSKCHADAGDRPQLPTMQSCLACHSGARELPCAGCHEALPSGRLRTSFPDGKLAPRGSWLGIAHDADFVVRHRWLAADHGAICQSCHVEDECAECHDGRRRPRKLHPNDYLSLHARDVARAATRCNGCHSQQSFCLACHARLGIAQLSAPDVASPRRFHPARALWASGPQLHAREAQRSLASCVSCHAERDCVDCHAAHSTGDSPRSPHPARFASDCGSAFARNPRPCLACHRASDAQLQRCR